jgi:hypothetical protein
MIMQADPVAEHLGPDGLAKLEELRVWQTSTGQYRALTNTTPFFEPRRDIATLPDSMRIDWLDSSFQKALQERKLWNSSLSSERRKATLHGSARNTLLEHGILQELERIEELGDTQAWWQKKTVSPFFRHSASSNCNPMTMPTFTSMSFELAFPKGYACQPALATGGLRDRSTQARTGTTNGPRISSQERTTSGIFSPHQVHSRPRVIGGPCCDTSGCHGSRSGDAMS